MRRGAVYTVVSVFMLLALAGLFFAGSRRDGHDAHAAVVDRVRSVDAFIDDFGKDGERAAYIAGFRTLIAMEQRVAGTGRYIPDPDAAFKEIFLNGTLQNESFDIMENSSFSAYLGRVRDDARTRGIVFDAQVLNVTLWQVEPWDMLVNYTLALNVTDERGTSSWQLNRTFTGVVPVTDLRDPLFSVGTLSRVQRIVKRTNVTLFVDDAGDANDTRGFMTHFNSSFYYAAGRGPSMLMRFSGNLSDSPYGLESLVDVAEVSAQGLAVNATSSVVDYEYFSGVEGHVCAIQNLPSTIRLANADLSVYGIGGKLTYVSC